MMILSIIYMSAFIVIAVSGIAAVALFKIDKNADRDERADQ
jgi:hypothetical protein